MLGNKVKGPKTVGTRKTKLESCHLQSDKAPRQAQITSL